MKMIHTIINWIKKYYLLFFYGQVTYFQIDIGIHVPVAEGFQEDRYIESYLNEELILDEVLCLFSLLFVLLCLWLSYHGKYKKAIVFISAMSIFCYCFTVVNGLYVLLFHHLTFIDKIAGFLYNVSLILTVVGLFIYIFGFDEIKNSEIQPQINGKNA